MKEFFKNKFFIILIFIALFLLGVALSTLKGNTNNIVNNTSGTVVTPVQGGITGVKNFFSNTFDKFFNYDKVAAENDSLKQKLTEAEKNVEQYKAFEEENARLKELLDIKEKKADFKFTSTRVIAKEPGDWFDIYTIDKGSLSGIVVNCPVITSYGFAGIVKEVGPNYSKVISLINTNSVVGAVVPRTGDVAVVEGDFELNKKGLCKLSFIDNKLTINIGDIVETSGLGGIFPSGIRLGRIEDILPDAHGVSRYAIIRPAVDFSKLKQVYVITDFEGIMKDDK